MTGAGAKSLTGQTLADGKYEIGELIGEGGMGTVYRARHVSLRRTVAIKVMHAEILSRPKAAARFEREARAASQLNHRNSVQVLDFGEERGMHYIVMEYVDGYDLGDVIHADGALSEERTCRIMVQVCAALAMAHDRGVIHRDLKPDNVVLTEGRDDDGAAVEIVKVCDFGIAKIQWGEPGERSATITEAGDITGTPHFMSPEQCQALPMDARSDIYSCGIILYNMVAGDVPFDAPTPVNIMVMHVAHAPKPPREVNPDISAEMESIILQALSKDPEARQQNVRQLRRQLVGHLRRLGVGTESFGTAQTLAASQVHGLAGISGQPTDETDPVPPPAGGRMMVVVAALFALLGAAAAGVGLWMSSGPSGEPAAETVAPAPRAEATPMPSGATTEDREPAPDPEASEPVKSQVPKGAPAPAEPAAVAPPTPELEAIDPPAEPAGADPADAPSPGEVEAAEPAAAAPEPPAAPAPEAAAEPAPERPAARPTTRPADPAEVAKPARSTPKPEAKRPEAPAPEVDAAEGDPARGDAARKEPPSKPEKAAPPEPAKEADGAPDEAKPAPKEEPPAVAEPAKVDAKPEPTEPPPPPKPAKPASFEASVSLGGVSASGSLPTSAVRKAAARVKGAFAQCYEKAARKAGRAPATKVKVKGIIDEDGRGRRFSASGGSLPGLAGCVKAAASGIRSRTRPDTGTVDASFEVHFKPKSP